MPTIEFTRMADPYIYGYTTTAGGYVIDVYRAEAGRWYAMLRVGTAVTWLPAGDNVPYPQAMAAARRAARELLRDAG